MKRGKTVILSNLALDKRSLIWQLQSKATVSGFSGLEKVTKPPVLHRCGCGSKPMGFHFVGAPPILEPILVGIGMFSGGAIWILTHGHVDLRSLEVGQRHEARFASEQANAAGASAQFQAMRRAHARLPKALRMADVAAKRRKAHLKRAAKDQTRARARAREQFVRWLRRSRVSIADCKSRRCAFMPWKCSTANVTCGFLAHSQQMDD